MKRAAVKNETKKNKAATDEAWRQEDAPKTFAEDAASVAPHVCGK